jgi:homoserine kinase type II
MLTRLYDWLHGPDGDLVVKRDPAEYIRKMRFHRAIVSPQEYGLP